METLEEQVARLRESLSSAVSLLVVTHMTLMQLTKGREINIALKPDATGEPEYPVPAETPEFKLVRVPSKKSVIIRN